MKQTIDDLRDEYEQLTGKKPAVRWTKKTLAKKITDARILKAGYAAKDKVEQQTKVTGDVKPEFEALAGGSEKTEDTEEAPQEKRGGPREGAGRPIGQTDERARIQRLLQLQVPDLCVRKFVQGINLIFARLTPVAFTADQVDRISLGLTLPLYYWFPSIEGAANPFVLHLQALEYIGSAVVERAEAVNIINQQQLQETKDGKDGHKNNGEITEETTEEIAEETAAAARDVKRTIAKRRPPKKRVTKARSHSKQRRKR